MALGTPKADYVVRTRDPFEKTGRQDGRRGISYPRILVCLVCGPSPSFLVAITLSSDSAKRHKPAKDRQTRPTISRPSTLRAILVRRRKFFHV